MVYIALISREYRRGRELLEFAGLFDNKTEACIELYGHMIDGDRTRLLEYHPSFKTQRYDNWETDSITFATVKSEFIKRRQAELAQEELDKRAKQRKDGALRPDDV